MLSIESTILVHEVGNKIRSNHLNRALKDILSFSTYLNQYFQIKRPWSNNSADTTLYVSGNAVRTLAVILAPFIPTSSEKIWGQLNIGDSVHRQVWSSCGKMQLAPGHNIGNVVPLFKKIEKETIDKLKAETVGDNRKH